MKFFGASLCFTFFLTFSIVGATEAVKCYECVYNCHSPVNVTCHDKHNDDFLCFSAKFPLGGKMMNLKGCVLADDQDFKDSCTALNQVENDSCYVCGSDFCNLL
ncbi:hypothetical protein TcasGA2_TC034069 [Tribolium castaneum]|uniref:Protein sleepless n=1 Tax=Tribolium castaneum TaxID=7070 RepID=A0A139WD32_TRICA|nr:PREDICTED: uncharacterized protein LOC103313963 [Tribolium castaneum]KYB25836.1 hypothetical protein TcasGA2_TC034069 [Tribolium castaneum]|eukprot:XP_008196825.1 PREDICTED: uncharacterized protein LOC103313963 [Tribolium castaneum]